MNHESESPSTTISASERGREVMNRLQNSVFIEKMDVYRFALALGLKENRRTPLQKKETMFNIGSFDKDRTIAKVVTALTDGDDANVYRLIEEYAETGFAQIEMRLSGGEFRFEPFLTPTTL